MRKVSAVLKVAPDITKREESLNEVVRNLSQMSKDLLERTIQGISFNEEIELTMERIVQDVNQSLNALHVLQEKVEAMNDILKSIREIHSQTHLLALNAAIEAAHAKEYGRGFSVVAVEIRKLSKHAEDAVMDVSNHLESVKDQVSGTTKGTAQSKKAIESSYEHIQHAVQAYMEIGQTASQLDVQAEQLVSKL